ncbi:hypothetical protein [Paludisphaera sp.]|uniref:hypothetical protein n=1 Tax=Paludisphaera sp. TaxID=2017432 RepID=UPI00301D5001
MADFVEYRDDWMSVALPANLAYKGGFWTFRSDARKFKRACVDSVLVNVHDDVAADVLLREFRAAKDRQISVIIQRILHQGPVDLLSQSFGVLVASSSSISDVLTYNYYVELVSNDCFVYVHMARHHKKPPYIDVSEFKSICDRISASVVVVGDPRESKPQGSG